MERMWRELSNEDDNEETILTNDFGEMAYKVSTTCDVSTEEMDNNASTDRPNFFCRSSLS